MVRARITSKGQVTIPVEIRRRYQLQAGDEIGFRADGSSVRILPLKKRKLTDLYGALPATKRYAGKGAEREEIGRMLGEELDRKLPRR